MRLLTALVVGAAASAGAAVADTPPIETLSDGSYVETVDGQTFGIRFSLGGEFTIRGKGLADTVNAWILGNQAGGSMLEVLSQSDEELVVRVTAIPAADEPWPANAGADSARGFVTVKIVADNGGRTFHARVRGAWYDCRRGEPNCG